MATFNIDIGTDYIEVWLTGLQENYVFIRSYDLTVYKYNNQNTPVGLDSDSDHNLDEDNPSESPHLIVTGLEPDTHYYYTFLCYNTSQGTFVSEEDDFWTKEETSSGGEEDELKYGWSNLGGTKTQSFSLSFELDDYKVGYIYFKPSVAGTIEVYTKSNYNMYGWLFYEDKGSLVDGKVGSSTIEGSYLKRNNNSGTDDNFYYSCSVNANTVYEIDIHEYNVGYCKGTLYVDFTPAVTNYTITYALGNGTGWSTNTAGLTQTTSVGSLIALRASNELFAYRNKDISSGNIITFNANGGNTTKLQQQSNKEKSFTHTKWNTNKEASVGTSYGFGETYYPTGNITFYPYFKESISYSKVKLPDAIECTRNGYTLLGWSNDSAAKDWSYAPGAEYPGDEATTLYAVWQEDSYQYTLNTANHVTIQADATPTGTYAPGTTITLSASVAAGYSFKQWTSSNTSLVSHKKNSVTSFLMPSGDIAMTPEVTLDTYTITLNLNDGSEETVREYTVESLPTVEVQKRTGYTFLGWTGSNGTTPQQTITIAKNDLGNKSYTANWQANTYTYNISCISKSGKNLHTQDVNGIFDTTNLITPPEITGYTTPSSQNVVWDSVDAKQIEFIYEPIEYTLSINYDNGTPYISDTYTIESEERELKSQSRNGYAFCGWTGTEITSPQETVTISSGSIGDRSYVATWAPLIIFNFKKSDTDLLKNLTNTQGIAINWYVSESQMKDFINKVNNYCNTTIALSEQQTLDNYNAIVDALNQSSAPNHFSGTTQPKLTKKSEDDYIKAQDLLDLENAFNNRKFI